jgi:hypothetical protein
MKTIFTFIALVFIFSSSYSQISIKPKAGIAFTTFQRPTDIFYSDRNQVPKLRFHGGIALELPFRKNLLLQTELLYTVKGLWDTTRVYSSRSIPGSTLPYYKGYGYNFHYIELPVLARIPFDRFHIGAGTSIAYLLGADKVLGTTKTVEKTPFGDRKLKYSRIDLSLNGELTGSIKSFELGLRYSYSLTTVKRLKDSDPEFYISDEKLGKNRSLQIYLAYTIKRML